MKKGMILFCAFLVMACLAGCQKSVPPISEQDVESITIWFHFGERPLNEEEIDTFVRLYSNSAHNGKTTGEGGTPDYGVRVQLTDGTELRMNQFGWGEGKDFELFYNGRPKVDCYVGNPDLKEFVLGILESIE